MKKLIHFQRNKDVLNANQYILSLKILEVLERDFPIVKNAILDKLDLSDHDFDHIHEQLRERVLNELEECGCCGGYHRNGYYGECRNDAERF